MPVDPCFAALLADPRNELRVPPAHVPLDAIRLGNKAFLTTAPVAPLHSLKDDVLPGPGGPLRVRFYRPVAASSLPLVVYMHGGGFALGDLDTHDSICSALALASGAVVCSVDYRLAPEARFPQPIEDGEAALGWLIANSSHVGVDPDRIALAGDSAGANLVTAVAIRARDAGHTLRHLAMLYPVVDPSCDSQSMHEFSSGYLLARSGMQWAWGLYLQQAADARDPEAALLEADLAGLPSTSIITAEYDPLRDEGEALAARLIAAGVTVCLRRYAGMVHGFAGLPLITQMAGEALREIAADLAAAFR